MTFIQMRIQRRGQATEEEEDMPPSIHTHRAEDDA